MMDVAVPAQGTTNYYSVTAYNAAGGESLPSNEISFAVKGNSMPIATAASVAVLEDGSASITLAGTDQDGYSVNYPAEYRKLGINSKDLKDITEYTSGARYNASQMQDLIDDAIEYVKAGSLRQVKDKQPIAVYLVATALLLYFIDTVVRRVNELRRLRNA